MIRHTVVFRLKHPPGSTAEQDFLNANPGFFRVPKHSKDAHVSEIRKRHQQAIDDKDRLYVPLSCIFEVADHVAHIDDGNIRRKTASSFLAYVKESVESDAPWNIVPFEEGLKTYFIPLIQDFSEHYMQMKIGLTDTTVIREAIRLKEKYKKSGYTVHIWTKDRSLKAYEPDTEENPFIG
jgi:hypothetical protein